MNKKTKLFLLMNIGNYVLVLLAFLGFRLGAGISFATNLAACRIVGTFAYFNHHSQYGECTALLSIHQQRFRNAVSRTD